MAADLVIGAGPSGVSAASALLARGRQVTMLDVGHSLGAARLTARDQLASRPPADWIAADRANWQAPQYATPQGQVRRFGSDFAMEPASATFADAAPDFGLRASRAVGGLSNLWGAAVLPYRGSDMAGWPITEADLAPHYQAVAGFMPISGQTDALQSLFPALSMAGHTALPTGGQAHAVLSRYHQQGDDPGATLGLARQAVAPGCQSCGQCLHGCPWGLIWQAGQHLAALRQSPLFTYRTGAPVRHIAETAGGVVLTLADGGTISGARVFLGAGVLESARILLASGKAGDSLTLLDSAHGFLPALQPRGPGAGPDDSPRHTLTQLFLEIDDPAISAHLVHAQIYGWNEFYARDLIAGYGRRLPFSAPLWQMLARRLLVAQIFLHSDHSARATLRLASDGRLTVAVAQNPDLPVRFAAAARRVGKSLSRGGLVPLGFAARLNPPGSSFHAGGTVPMASNPLATQSDRIGRPAGRGRLHLIDASILPAIPATTITLPVMANAHRIGTLAP